MKPKPKKRLQAKKPMVQPEIEQVATEYPPLVWNHTKPYFIAVSEWGYDIHQVVAVAVRLAQDRVPAKAKPSQMLIYRSETEVEPIGFDSKDGPTWPESNGVKPRGKKAAKTITQNVQPKLVGLTTTHRLFVQTPRVV